ncbi:MAG: four helix bundle protein [Myxococcota bacterium]
MHPDVARVAPGIERNESDVDFAATQALHADHHAMVVVFDHEKLEVYRIAVEYADVADGIAGKLKHGNAHIRDQLRRASDSTVNNIAEGAGEFLPNEKARFYRIALRCRDADATHSINGPASDSRSGPRTGPGPRPGRG